MRTIRVVSFAYKFDQQHTLEGPTHIYDCRGLPNPFNTAELREGDGRDDVVRKFVFHNGRAEALVRQAMAEVQSYRSDLSLGTVTFAFGCVGGRHRSVACAEVLYSHLTHQQGPRCFVHGIELVGPDHLGLLARGLV